MKVKQYASLGIWVLIISFIAVACSSQQPSLEDTPSGNTNNTTPTFTEEPELDVEPTVLEPTSTRDPDEPPAGAQVEFITDFSNHSVDYSEILSGGPPKDGIPAIDTPQFISADEAELWLEDVEPVVVLDYKGEVHVYPIQILMWHEIINDQFGDEQVSVTFCPLCNTSIAFSGKVGNIQLTFGTTGRLRFSNLIMYDRETQTWWQQASGEAIAGSLTGKQLAFIPASTISWLDAKTQYPNALVLSRETGHSRRYGSNPYPGYDDVSSYPFLYYGPDLPTDLAPLARVVGIDLNEVQRAYPFTAVQQLGVVNDEVGGNSVLLIWQAGAVSPFDPLGVEGVDIGSVAAFSPLVEGETLTFSLNDKVLVDDNTGSSWNFFGEAVSGALEGTVLEPLVATHHFWFSWAAFFTDTTVYISVD